MIQVVELLNACPDVINQFQDEVRRKLKVGIIILIHPFYSAETNPAKNKRYVKEEYPKERDKFIKSHLIKSIPFVIFQQEKDYSELLPKLKKLGDGIVYTVKTEMGQHYPIGGDETWEKFINILNTAGIKHIILGGMYLVSYKSEFSVKTNDSKYDQRGTLLNYVKNMPKYVHKYQKARRWIEKDIAPTGCVGYAAMEFLNSGIDVTFSRLTTPCSGTEYFAS